MERDYDNESLKDHIVTIVAVVISVFVTGLITLALFFLWSIESYGFWGDHHNERSPMALTLLAVSIVHLVLMGFMLFARRIAFKLMIVLSIGDMILVSLVVDPGTGIFCPLSNIVFLVITLGQLGKNPLKETGGFAVIVKDKEKPTE